MSQVVNQPATAKPERWSQIKSFFHSRAFNILFWVANLAVMAFSAQNAGYMFGLYEWSGYAVGVVLDLLIIVFTNTMLAAKARGEIRRAVSILFFIVVCCSFSVTGNLEHNLSQKVAFDASVWFQSLVPYIVSLMPLFLVALAWVADLKIDPLEKESPEAYAAAEKKRARFRQIQLDNREARAAMEVRIISIEKREKINRRLRAGKLPKFFRYPWEQVLMLEAVVAGVADSILPGYNHLEKAVTEKLNSLSEVATNLEQVTGKIKDEVSKSLLAQVDESLEKLASNFVRKSDLEDLKLQLKLKDDLLSKLEDKLEQLENKLDEVSSTTFQSFSNLPLATSANSYYQSAQINRDSGELEAFNAERFNNVYGISHEPDMNRLQSSFEPDYGANMNRSDEPDTAEREKLNMNVAPDSSNSRFVAEFKAGSSPVRGSNGLKIEDIIEMEEAKAAFKRIDTRRKAVQAAIASGHIKKWGDRYSKASVNVWLESIKEKV